MIDRIPSGGYYNQNTPYSQKVKSNTETFSMEYDRREPDVSQKKDEEDKTQDSVIEKLLKEEKDEKQGVQLELSASAESAKVSDGQQEEQMFDSLRGRLKELWKDVKAAFVRFFKGDSDREQSIEPSEAVPSEEEKQPLTQIEPVLTEEQQLKKSLNRAEQAYLEYAKLQEEKSLAKNSDLLTTYNKRGTIVQMDAAKKNRILHAHPNQIDETF